MVMMSRREEGFWGDLFARGAKVDFHGSVAGMGRLLKSRRAVYPHVLKVDREIYRVYRSRRGGGDELAGDEETRR
jgi:hypothetical protein